VHWRAGHDHKSGYGRERADSNRQHKPPNVPAHTFAIQSCGIIEVVDDVNGIIDGDADSDGGKAGRDRGKMMLPKCEHDASHERPK